MQRASFPTLKSINSKHFMRTMLWFLAMQRTLQLSFVIRIFPPCVHREVQKFLPSNRLDGLYASFLRTLLERNIPQRARRRWRFISLRLSFFSSVCRRLELVETRGRQAHSIPPFLLRSFYPLLRFHSLSLLCK